ncbi:hypothetical protein GQ44DRAFT_780081 [Phaeosphaeriaceae sp. PMI808]|nr:hypothetical protein GQ44DRAFT_780081 [Phaeosphaeriaceae sp. PMI808]
MLTVQAKSPVSSITISWSTHHNSHRITSSSSLLTPGLSWKNRHETLYRHHLQQLPQLSNLLRPSSKFMSPAKRKSDQLLEPLTPNASSDNSAPMTTPTSRTPETSYTRDMSTIHVSPPLKRPRTDYILQSSFDRDPSSSITLDDSSNTDTPLPRCLARLFARKAQSVHPDGLVVFKIRSNVSC